MSTQYRQVGPFLGLNNLLSTSQLQAFENDRKLGDYLRVAENIDVTDSLAISRRQGWLRMLEGHQVHSLHGLEDGTALMVDYDTLYRVTWAGDLVSKEAVLGSLTPGLAMSYCTVAGKTVMSNGAGIWCTTQDGMDCLAIALPHWLPQLSATAGAGSLPPGMYQAYITLQHKDGRESGSSEPVQVRVPHSGSLRIRNLPHRADAGVQWICLYMTQPNGDVFYLVERLPIGASETAITVLPDGGARCMTERMQPIPAGHIVREHRGRLLVASASVLYRSQPWAYGLYMPTEDYIPFPSAITILEPVPGGVYVVADKTYFIAEDFNEAIREVLPFGAAVGAVAQIHDSGVYWFSDRGLVLAGAEGEVRELHSQSLSVTPAKQAALMVREQNGMRHVIASVRDGGSGQSIASATSTMDVCIVKKGAFSHE